MTVMMMWGFGYTTVLLVVGWAGVGARAAEPLGTGVLERLWARLGTADPVEAEQAMACLVANPAQTVSFLRRHLRPIVLDARRVAQWLADLDSNRFLTRERAAGELGRLAEAVESLLRQALSNNPSLEVRRRIERLLDRLRAERLSPPPGRRRDVRAIEVLERIGSSEAHKLLTTLARGEPAASLTIEAKAALERLVREGASPP